MLLQVLKRMWTNQDPHTVTEDRTENVATVENSLVVTKQTRNCHMTQQLHSQVRAQER